MTMSSTTPGIVLVHGAFHTAEHFSSLKAGLEDLGYEVNVPTLPSVTTKPDPGDGLALDTAAVADAIRSFVDCGKDVVLHMHSYGGIPGSEAAAVICEENQQTSTGKGRMRKLIYLSSATRLKGEAFIEQAPGDPDRFVDITDGGVMTAKNSKETFYNTTPADVADDAVAKLADMIWSPLSAKTQYCGWRDYGIPVTYIMCTIHDQALPLEAQKKMVERMTNEGIEVDVREIESDHSPYLGKPAEYVDLVAQVLAQ